MRCLSQVYSQKQIMLPEIRICCICQTQPCTEEQWLLQLRARGSQPALHWRPLLLHKHFLPGSRAAEHHRGVACFHIVGALSFAACPGCIDGCGLRDATVQRACRQSQQRLRRDAACP